MESQTLAGRAASQPMARAAVALSLGLAAALTSAPAWAQSTTHSMLAHFNSLGATYPALVQSDPWTFRSGSSAGALFTSSTTYYVGTEAAQNIGIKVLTGTAGCTPGFCVVPYNDTLATFDGVFVHPGSSNAVAAVYRFDTPQQLLDLQLWTEGVTNSANGNGMQVTIGVVRSGITTVLDQFVVSHFNTVSTALLTTLQPGLQMLAGDTLQVVYGNNGSYLFDHYNTELQFSTTPIPEPATAALWLVGLAGLSRMARSRRQA